MFESVMIRLNKVVCLSLKLHTQFMIYSSSTY
jgi:hypothetical protein